MEFIFIIAILIFSVIAHEVAHGYAASALGDPTAKLQGRLSLNPLVHIDPIGSILVPAICALLPGSFVIGWAKPVPYNPYNFQRFQKHGDALVAAAGPLTNILLAIIFGLVVRFGAGSFSAAFLEISSLVVIINLVLALFNLVPIPPLDGSKILFAFLPYRLQSLRVSLEQFGFMLVLLFVIFFWEYVAILVAYAFALITGMSLGL